MQHDIDADAYDNNNNSSDNNSSINSNDDLIPDWLLELTVKALAPNPEELLDRLTLSLEKQFPQDPTGFVLTVWKSFMHTNHASLGINRIRLSFYLDAAQGQRLPVDLNGWTPWNVINLLKESLYDGFKGSVIRKAPTMYFLEHLDKSDEDQMRISNSIFLHDV